jgi:mannan endo-1,4-beta-mannosidase
MSFIGKSLRGSPFLQDPKPEWIKINSVVMGESPEFGYKTFWSKDIGNLLDSLVPDDNITCVLYNWNTGYAYTKTNFDLNNMNDSKYNSDYTTFIKLSDCTISKLSQYQPQPQTTQEQSSQTTQEQSSQTTQEQSSQPMQEQPSKITQEQQSDEFIRWDGSNFVYNNDIFVPVGPNVYWLGYTEFYDYPSRNQVVEMFEVAKKMGSTVIRSHTLGISSGSAKSLRPSNNILNEDAWDAIDFAFYTASTYNIKLICPLTDAYTWYNGNYGDFCKTRFVDKKDFWTNIDVRNDFKDFIYKWLNHYNKYTGKYIKDDSTLAMIELGNELGNIRPDHGSINVPTKEWLIDITNYIKSIDSKHLILGPSDECLGSSESDDFNVKNIDVYSGHFYSKDFNRIDFGANSAKNVNKPYIIGEYSPHFDDEWFTEIEKRQNVKGSIFWNLYPHENGLAGGNKIEHLDGQTVWYPEDKSKLLKISNHFRRMRGLPIVQNI